VQAEVEIACKLPEMIALRDTNPYEYIRKLEEHVTKAIGIKVPLRDPKKEAEETDELIANESRERLLRYAW
jgi:hypothetical protein